MADGCSNCFYARPDSLTNLHCHRSFPSGSAEGTAVFPQVDPDDWCGEGYGNDTGRYYTPGAAGYGDLITSADQSIPNVTLVDVTGLATNLVAGSTYYFDVIIFYTDVGGGNAGGIQLAMQGDLAGATLYDGYQIDGAGISGQGRSTLLGGVVANADSRRINAEAIISGYIDVTTSGTLKVQAAQNSASATPTVIKTGSRMIVRAVP